MPDLLSGRFGIKGLLATLMIGILGIYALFAYPFSQANPCKHPPSPRLAIIPQGAVPKQVSRLTVATLNIDNTKNPDDLLKPLADAQRFQSLDVLLLQEVDFNPEISPTVTALATSLTMNLVYATENQAEAGTARGLAILSRYPINGEVVLGLPWFNRLFNPRCRIALGVSIQAPIGTVRVFNVHLDNRINTRERLEQVQVVIDAAEEHDGSKVIGGDFNTADVLWLSHVLPIPLLEDQSGSLRELMEQHGYYDPFAGVASTNDYLPLNRLFPLKLDWLFVSGLSARHWEVREVDFSDHHLLVAELDATGAKRKQ